MTDSGQFGMSCEACEGMCLDAVDGTLTPAEQEVFDRHVAGCVACAEQLSEAKRGAAWMEMLKTHRPEPSERLLQRILARTSEAAPMLPIAAMPVPAVRAGWWRRAAAAFSFDAAQAHFQPRLAMTAAMAFFSIALTMNLGGVRLADLKPGAIQRSFADARASATRSFQSMKVVYQVESRVNELRDDDRDPGGPFGSSSDEPKQAPATKAAPEDEKPKGKDDVPKGSSRLTFPVMERVSEISNQ